MNCQPCRSERGAILVFTAVGLTVLIGVLAFVIDQGVWMVARPQAQNAADAGALAGAVGLTFDEVAAPPASDGPAWTAAIQAALVNTVWNEAPVVVPTLPDPCPSGGAAGLCIRVDVFRDDAHNNPLPVFFAPVLGIMSQRVRATATAETSPANATGCERAFALPDTGMTVPDLGTELILSPGAAADVSVGKYRLLDVWQGTAVNAQSAVRRCSTATYGIADTLPLATVPLASDAAGIVAGVQDLIALDPSASWDGTDLSVSNSCVTTHTCVTYTPDGQSTISDPLAAISPRVVVLPLFDPVAFLPLSGLATVTNHIALFLTDAQINGVTGEPEIRGRIATTIGQVRSNKPVPAFNVAFLRRIQLVR